MTKRKGTPLRLVKPGTVQTSQKRFAPHETTRWYTRSGRVPVKSFPGNYRFVVKSTPGNYYGKYPQKKIYGKTGKFSRAPRWARAFAARRTHLYSQRYK